MDAKQYLRKVRYLDKTISAKLEQIETLHAQVTKTTTVLSDMPGCKGNQDKLAKTIAKIVDLKKGLRQEIEDYVDLKEEAIRLIDSMSDGRHRLVLTYRYINGKTWEEIAVEMHYTYKWVHVLHGQALADFENVLRMRKST
jgi:DNA-directed RNA polymerase specialized sigma subunit